MADFTAMEHWASKKGSTAADAPHDAEVEAHISEDDLAGGMDVHGGDEEYAGGGADGPDDAAAAAAEAVAANKKKGMKTLFVAGAVCAVIVMGIVGLKVAGSGGATQQQMEPQLSKAQVDGQGEGQTTPVVASIQSAPTDLALPVFAVPSDPLSPLAQVGMPAVQVGTPIAPVATVDSVVQATQVGSASALVAQPVAMQPPPAIQATPSKVGRAVQPDLAADFEKLQAEFSALKTALDTKSRAVDELSRDVRGLRTQIAAMPSVNVVAKAAVVNPKVIVKAVADPVVKRAERVDVAVAATPTSVVAQLTAAKSKVRADYRIYAAVDGRFWLKGPDGESFQVGNRSPLPDGSKVTGFDVEKSIVLTTTGEIH